MAFRDVGPRMPWLGPVARASVRARPAPSSPPVQRLDRPQLIDERSRPDFRDVYARRAARSVCLDAAVGRIRLGGMNLGERELGGLSRIRLVVGQLGVLTLSSEAETLAADPARRPRLALLLSLFEAGRLNVRIAPLAGWNPDFSVFHPSDRPDGSQDESATVLLGPHLFDRPYPHPGPAFGIELEGDAATLAAERFEVLWMGAHDLKHPIVSVLSDALAKG